MLSYFENISVKSLRYVARLIGFPFIAVAILGWSLMPYLKGYAKEVIAFGLLYFICFISIIIIRPIRIKKALLYIFYSILSLLAFIKLSFYHLYGVKLSSSALFVIFETNASESTEFMESYLDVYVISLFILLFLPLFFSKKLLNSEHLYRATLKSKLLISICAVLILSSGYIIYEKFYRENIILTSLLSYKDYQLTKKKLKNQLAETTSAAFQNVSYSDESQTHVVVIGEATSNWHMQLYGYNRETNPRLNEIKEELWVFDSVITPHVHTILALEKMFTLSNYDTPNPEKNGSMVQLANQAGYDTFWISNQKPVGLHESIPTLIGSAAKHKRFLATDDYTYDIYDENVLPALQEALKSKSKKKLIFVHLIGAHSVYKRRYPKSFAYFKDINPITKIKHEKAIETVNHYDNAIRYNDSIMRQVIEYVKALETKSYVAYFSDHGDEVYDTMDLGGHNEYHATRPMYEVPLIIWLSNDYKKAHPELINSLDITKRRYNLEDFIHSFSTLSGIEFSEIDKSRSIMDSSYIVRTRFIKKGEDYDKR